MASNDKPEQACLNDFDLRRCCAGEMSADAQSAAREHLAHCADCARRAEALEAQHESWVEHLRDVGAPPESGATSAAQTPQPVLRQIAGYDIEEEINRGGQGVVFRAVQRSTKRRVAIKVLREGPLASQASQRRFEREIELVAGLRHPRIVTVFDSGITEQGQRWCAMDFVSGIRLDDYVRGKRLSVAQTLELMAGVCEAVNHAHQRGIIHRDLKPSNVLVDESGEPNILDFGLARHEGDAEETALTAPSVIAGTLPYLSPEQVRGRRADIDIRSDVYALGVMLYEVLTGRYPYDVSGPIGDAFAHIADTPPARPSRITASSASSDQRRRRIDDEIETIVLKSLAKEPDRRYQSAGELARDLRRYLAGEPIEAKRDSNWYILRKAVQRNKLPAAGIATLIVVITAATISLAVMYGRQAILLEEVNIQRLAAQQAEAQATRRFDQVRELAKAFIFELEPKVRHLVGSTEVRAFIAGRGLEYLDSLAADAGDDPDMMADLGAAYFRIGDIQGDPQLPNLGDREGALESYRKGLEHLETLAALQPDNAEVRDNLIDAHFRIASLLHVMGRSAESEQSFRKARSLIDSMLAITPDDAALLRNLANANDLIADGFVATGRFDEAIELYEKNLEFNEEQYGKDAVERDVLVSYYKIGNAHMAKGDTKSAVPWLLRYIEGMEQLARNEPNSALARDDLGWGYERLAFAYQLLGDMPASLEAARNGVRIHSRIAEADPHHLRALSGVCSSYCRVGEAQLAMGQLEAARESFLLYQKNAEQLAASQPDSAAEQREVAVAAYKLSELERQYAQSETLDRIERAEHWREARHQLEECLAVFVQMKERGMLSATDATVPDDLATEIQACDEQISTLESDNKSQPAHQ